MSKKKVSIERFMTRVLNLNGNELVLFAILWAESNGGEKSVGGDYVRLSAAMNVTVPTMYKCMSKLIDRGYVEKNGKEFSVVVMV